MAVFLVSNPWPNSSLKPIDFVITSPDYVSPVTEPALSNPDGSVYLKHEVSSFAADPGSHVLSIVARNIWGTGPIMNFPFESGLPTPGTGLRLVSVT